AGEVWTRFLPIHMRGPVAVDNSGWHNATAASILSINYFVCLSTSPKHVTNDRAIQPAQDVAHFFQASRKRERTVQNAAFADLPIKNSLLPPNFSLICAKNSLFLRVGDLARTY